MAWFRILWLDPASLAGTFFPVQAEDNMAMVARAIGDGTTWYRCPNGHAYVVGNCGQTMQIGRCASCGVPIGGQNHQALAGQQVIGHQTAVAAAGGQAETGYCFRSVAEEADASAGAPRGMAPTTDRMLRLTLHAALLVGAVSSGAVGAPWGGPAVFNRAHTNPPDVVGFVVDHVRGDWHALTTRVVRRPADDVASIVHLLAEMHMIGGEAAVVATNVRLGTTAARQMWEQTISGGITALSATAGFEERIAAANRYLLAQTLFDVNLLCLSS